MKNRVSGSAKGALVHKSWYSEIISKGLEGVEPMISLDA